MNSCRKSRLLRTTFWLGGTFGRPAKTSSSPRKIRTGRTNAGDFPPSPFSSTAHPSRFLTPSLLTPAFGDEGPPTASLLTPAFGDEGLPAPSLLTPAFGDEGLPGGVMIFVPDLS